jgi:hypothetical protein
VGGLPGIRPQPDEFHHEFKSSWFLERATAGAIRRLKPAFISKHVALRVKE